MGQLSDSMSFQSGRILRWDIVLEAVGQDMVSENGVRVGRQDRWCQRTIEIVILPSAVPTATTTIATSAPIWPSSATESTPIAIPRDVQRAHRSIRMCQRRAHPYHPVPASDRERHRFDNPGSQFEIWQLQVQVIPMSSCPDGVAPDPGLHCDDLPSRAVEQPQFTTTRLD